MLSLPDLPRDDERLLRLGALPAGIEAALVPVRATLHEAVNQGFTLVLELLAAPSPQRLRALVGEALTLRLKQADGRYTPWHGCVAEAVRLGRVGALVHWRLLLRPWLSWLALRQDSFVYQERTALQIVESVFADHPGARWRIDCAEATLQAMRVRELCIQVYTPRIGAEAAIEFLDGDIDRPVVAGGLYHGDEPPPFAAGCDSGVNHAGALSGLHSRGLGGDGFNQWVLDDSTGQLRMRLHASTAGSELGLGQRACRRRAAAEPGEPLSTVPPWLVLSPTTITGLPIAHASMSMDTA